MTIYDFLVIIPENMLINIKTNGLLFFFSINLTWTWMNPTNQNSNIGRPFLVFVLFFSARGNIGRPCKFDLVLQDHTQFKQVGVEPNDMC